MSVVDKVIGFFGGNMVKDIGEAIDRNVTSDEERMQLHNELEQIHANTAEGAQKFAEVVEQNVTQRHQVDMQSDSRLAKNVRPVVLVVLTLFTISFFMIGIYKELAEYSYKAWEVGLNALVGLDMLVYGFYFGSRGAEKVAEKITALIKK